MEAGGHAPMWIRDEIGAEQLFNNRLCQVSTVAPMLNASLPRMWIQTFFHTWTGENAEISPRIVNWEKRLERHLVFHLRSTG
jgi:hypothetical protein